MEARSSTLSQQVLCKDLNTTVKWQLPDQSNSTENQLSIAQASTEEPFERTSTTAFVPDREEQRSTSFGGVSANVSTHMKEQFWIQPGQ